MQSERAEGDEALGRSAKKLVYEAIVSARKACRLCTGTYNPSVIARGRFDSEHVGPWTVWQGNLGAELMIVGQDWGGNEYLKSFTGTDKKRNPTNVRLRSFLKAVGFRIELPEDSTGRGELYFTNAMLCCREGLLTESETTKTKPVKSIWFRNCERLLRAQVELVSPRVIVTLGYYAYRSVLSSFGMRPEHTMRAAVEKEEFEAIGKRSIVVPVYHCGNNGLRSRNIDQQTRDWDRVRIALTMQRATTK